MANTLFKNANIALPRDSHRIGRLLQVLGHMALWIALLFGCAGSWQWIRGWICAVVYFGAMTVTGLVIHHFNHDLMEARAKWRHKDTKAFDKVFVAIFLPLVYIQPAVAGLDVVRFHWSKMPFWTVYPGVALFLTGMAIVTWTMMVNPYAETTVRIQTDRGQTVISSGPYRFVRHPMYVGTILMYPATGLILGSEWAILVAAVVVFLLLIRTALEDRTLRRELPGYEEYTALTQYRLFPGVW